MAHKTILISINATWNIVNFRGGLIQALRRRGYRVVALAPPDEYVERLVGLGVEYHSIEIDKQGSSAVRDLVLLWRYVKAMRRIGPDLFLGYTAKPNIYGSLAAHVLGVPVINNVAGLGTAFIKQGLLTRIVSALYRLAFSRSKTVFFQNDEDRQKFIREGIVRPEKALLVPGSGIDLTRFLPESASESGGKPFTFLLIARLLWDKGIAEYVEASRRVTRCHPTARFQVLGFLDVPNRTAVSRAEVDSWVREGVIDYLGRSDDVRPAIAAADCVVLPSYREGLPRALLEGAAMAKPLIATDVPGCRHVVTHGSNGLLCEVRDAGSLAEAMLAMLSASPEERVAMGAAGRTRIESEFDEQILIDRYMKAIEAALPA